MASMRREEGGRRGIVCPVCGKLTRIAATVPELDGTVRRRRRCPDGHWMAWTVERVRRVVREKREEE